MSPFKSPAPVHRFLRETPGRAIIRDPGGRVIGFYSPAEADAVLRNGRALGLTDRQVPGGVESVAVDVILRQATEPVALCDEAGNVFGHYAPVPPDLAEFVASVFPPPDPSKAAEDPLAELRADFDLAAAEREMASNPPTFTLAEVYGHLLAITPEPELRADLEERIARLKERDRCGIP